jgi:hypothetical protein
LLLICSPGPGLRKQQKERGFLTSTAELLRTGVLTSRDDYVNQYEWLALDRIPASLVVFENRFPLCRSRGEYSGGNIRFPPLYSLPHDVMMITESEPVLTSTQ